MASSDSAITASVFGAIAGGVISWIISCITLNGQRRSTLLRDIKRRVAELESKGRLYWITNGRQIALSQEINALFLYLSQDITDLKVRSDKHAVSNKATFGYFFNSITGGTFDTNGHQADIDQIPIIQEHAKRLLSSVSESCT